MKTNPALPALLLLAGMMTGTAAAQSVTMPRLTPTTPQPQQPPTAATRPPQQPPAVNQPPNGAQPP